MKGADFVAIVPLYGATGALLAAAGARCDEVPEASLAWLQEGGYIKSAEPKAKARRAAAAPEKEE